VIQVPNLPGIGYEVNRQVLESYRLDKSVFTATDILR
jgi:o-succinylbenzoate synthase